MKQHALFVMCLAAACGGPTRTTTTGNTGGGSGAGAGGGMSATELWTPVMKPGAIFSFNDRVPDSPTAEEFTTVEATVASVADVPGGKAVTLAWTFDGEPAGGTMLPVMIVVTDAEVRFQADPDHGDALTWPSSTAVADVDRGDYTSYVHDGMLAGEKCYGLGPAADAGDCEDVCYAEVCVHPKHGLTGGSGTWWPNFSVFQRRDLMK